MSKQSIKRRIRDTEKGIKVWQLMILLVMMSFVTATFMRVDNIGMMQLRAAVLAADEEGDKEKLDSALKELKGYVFTHMNSDTGVFQLANQYKRDFDAAMKEAGGRAESSNPNGNIYKKASDKCDPKFAMYSPPYLSCIMNELSKYPSAGDIKETFDPPSTELYRLEYVSPIWTISPAGASAAICVLIVLAIVTRILSLIVLKLLFLRYRNS